MRRRRMKQMGNFRIVGMGGFKMGKECGNIFWNDSGTWPYIMKQIGKQKKERKSG